MRWGIVVPAMKSVVHLKGGRNADGHTGGVDADDGDPDEEPRGASRVGRGRSGLDERNVEGGGGRRGGGRGGGRATAQPAAETMNWTATRKAEQADGSRVAPEE